MKIASAVAVLLEIPQISAGGCGSRAGCPPCAGLDARRVGDRSVDRRRSPPGEPARPSSRHPGHPRAEQDGRDAHRAAEQEAVAAISGAGRRRELVPRRRRDLTIPTPTPRPSSSLRYLTPPAATGAASSTSKRASTGSRTRSSTATKARSAYTASTANQPQAAALALVASAIVAWNAQQMNRIIERPPPSRNASSTTCSSPASHQRSQ